MSTRSIERKRYTVTVTWFENPDGVVIQIDNAGKHVLTLAGVKADKFLQAIDKALEDIAE